MAVLKRVEAGLPVPEICRELGIRCARRFISGIFNFKNGSESPLTRMRSQFLVTTL